MLLCDLENAKVNVRVTRKSLISENLNKVYMYSFVYRLTLTKSDVILSEVL